MSNEEKTRTVIAVLSAALRSTPEVDIVKAAHEVVEALSPRVFAHGEDIPPHTVVMGEDGGIHGHPGEDQFCYDEGFGAHLGWLVEVPNPDDWNEAVARASAARSIARDVVSEVSR